jgi:hypothetical protein
MIVTIGCRPTIDLTAPYMLSLRLQKRLHTFKQCIELDGKETHERKGHHLKHFMDDACLGPWLKEMQRKNFFKKQPLLEAKIRNAQWQHSQIIITSNLAVSQPLFIDVHAASINPSAESQICGNRQ